MNQENKTIPNIPTMEIEVQGHKDLVLRRKSRPKDSDPHQASSHRYISANREII